MIYEINTNYGGKSKVKPSVELYAVKDFTGKEMSGLAIRLTDAETLEPFMMLTKSFGEFIGIKNAAYIDTNNCPFANQLFEKGIARDTGLKKTSGRCEYPLWIFNKDFLLEHGAENYQKYSDAYDEYMKPYTSETEETDENQEIGGMKQ